MKKRLLSTLLILCMVLAYMPIIAYADTGDDVSDLFRQGDTGNLLTIDDFSFFGHPISELSYDIEVMKSIMSENVTDLQTSNTEGMFHLAGV